MAQGLKRRVSILGATGSIGESTAAVILEARARGAEIIVEAIAGGRDVARLVDMAKRLRPNFVAIGDPLALSPLREALAQAGLACEAGAGPQAVCEAAARDADWVMSAMVGAAALEPTLEAIKRGARVAIANKESIVCAGALLMAAAAASGAQILPVDSEHNAIFQVMGPRERVETITLTASGGPFRTWSLEQMAAVTPAQALKHPVWSMGAKNTLDSATLMNKGLELIEAAVLFAAPEAMIEVVVHPQSIIHSLVTYCDGSALAQLSEPDMRVPIAHALAWPDRLALSTRRLDLARLGALTFEAVDDARFPALGLARAALRAGGARPTVFNAANEIAASAFLDGRIGFLDIAAVVAESLEAAAGEALAGKTPSSFAEVMAVDGWARQRAETAVQRFGR